MHSPFWSISLAIYKYFLLLVFAFILCPNLSPCLFCVCSAFWFSCHALRQIPAHLQMFQDRAQTLVMTFRWCNSARSDFMMDISSPTSNTSSTGASGCRVIEHNSLEQMINTYQKCTLQLKRNLSCYLAAAVIHLSLPWSAAGDFSRFTCKGKVTGLDPQAVNTSLPSGITWLYYYYWHIVLRQQRHSFKDIHFYFQLYYIYFCLNLFKDNIINPGTKGRKEMEAHNALDNDRKQPVFWQFPQFSSRWSLPKN